MEILAINAVISADFQAVSAGFLQYYGMDDTILTINEITAFIKFNERTVYRLAARSKIPRIQNRWFSAFPQASHRAMD
jgi:hypothetical protein